MSRPTERAENPLRRRVEKAHCVSKGGLRLPKPKQSPPSVSQPGPRVSKPTGRDDNPQTAPPTLPKPEILPQNDTPHLANAHNGHPNNHRDAHPANANTQPTNNHPFNDHRLNDHQVKTARKLGRRPHARRIAGGEGGGSLAPVPPPQDSGGGHGTLIGLRPKESPRRRARRQDSRRRKRGCVLGFYDGGCQGDLSAIRNRNLSQPIPTGAHARRIAGGHCAPASACTPRRIARGKQASLLRATVVFSFPPSVQRGGYRAQRRRSAPSRRSRGRCSPGWSHARRLWEVGET